MISQYHDIDSSYIDIDIGKNAFLMTSLLFGLSLCPPLTESPFFIECVDKRYQTKNISLYTLGHDYLILASQNKYWMKNASLYSNLLS